ncbi:MAG TPA: hypothetical protein VKU39_03765 [Streptosporangiaceae bacterium]|nr:hypothetical protein [Streptosporangiaceae bacterium]
MATAGPGPVAALVGAAVDMAAAQARVPVVSGHHDVTVAGDRVIVRAAVGQLERASGPRGHDVRTGLRMTLVRVAVRAVTTVSDSTEAATGKTMNDRTGRAMLVCAAPSHIVATARVTGIRVAPVMATGVMRVRAGRAADAADTVRTEHAERTALRVVFPRIERAEARVVLPEPPVARGGQPVARQRPGVVREPRRVVREETPGVQAELLGTARAGSRGGPGAAMRHAGTHRGGAMTGGAMTGVVTAERIVDEATAAERTTGEATTAGPITGEATAAERMTGGATTAGPITGEATTAE